MPYRVPRYFPPVGTRVRIISLIIIFSTISDFIKIMNCFVILRKYKSTSKVFSGGIRRMSINVKRMNVTTFGEILRSANRCEYQIIDVREKSELALVSIPGNDIVNLPLSTAHIWSNDIITGKLLDSEKPTLCLCHHGVRSMQMATFLGK